MLHVTCDVVVSQTKVTDTCGGPHMMHRTVPTIHQIICQISEKPSSSSSSSSNSPPSLVPLAPAIRSEGGVDREKRYGEGEGRRDEEGHQQLSRISRPPFRAYSLFLACQHSPHFLSPSLALLPSPAQRAAFVGAARMQSKKEASCDTSAGNHLI